MEAREKCSGHEIVAADLPGYLAQAELKAMYPAPKSIEPIDLEKTLATVERELLIRALNSAKGNKTAAAQFVGMSRPRFYRRLVELGLIEAELSKPNSNQSSDPPTQPRAESKSRDAARKRKNRKPTPFDNLPDSPSASPDDPDFIDDIPFIPTEESNEDEE
jgi:DNA-binding protein Fis